jgi:superfamily II DNA helicase RecQ
MLDRQRWDWLWKDSLNGYTPADGSRGCCHCRITVEAFTDHASRGTGTFSDQAACDQSRCRLVVGSNQGIPCHVSTESLTSSPTLPQGLKKGAYNVVIVSPEQFFHDPTSGATPRLLGLLQNQPFLRSIKHMYVDEGHELFFSGVGRHEIPAFRPSYGMLDKIIPKLPNETPVHVLSATLPPHVIRVIEKKLFGSRERTRIQLPLNRGNIVYTTRTIADLSEYKNLSFLIPHRNPDSRPSGIIIFFESSVRADDAASYLNNNFRILHPTSKISRVAASYHAGLSQTHLTRIFQQFCGTHESKERIDILCATSCGATV